MVFTVMDQYESFVNNNFIKRNTTQIKLIEDINLTWKDYKKNSFFSKRKNNGVYFYGSVGTGKTFLLSLVCHFSKVGKKIHYNHLMNEIHTTINSTSNNHKKLEQYVKKLTSNIDILFIDELHIYNIVDALIINKIFSLFEESKIFVMVSSNFAPNDLYKDGLQREDFLPFINYINDKFKVIYPDYKTDYRRLTLNQSKTYFTPINRDTTEEFNKLFERLIDVNLITSIEIKTKSRSLIFNKCIANVAFCNFDFLCASNLAHEDYNNIAKEFHLIFIKDVPQFLDNKADQCRRFISLIDMLYAQNSSVVILAETPISQLCKIEFLSKEFERTSSRLYEMTIIKPS